MKYLLIFKIIILKLIHLNISFLKREITGYPNSVIKFENDFAKYIDKSYGLTFCNGTSSIEAAIFSLNLDDNDEILVTSSNFHASIGPILSLKLKPVFVDIKSDTYTIDCEDLEKKITNKSKALLIVHPWGYPCDMEGILKITKKNNLKLIEDCSHAHGALYNNNKIGSFGDISCFSLQGAKSIKAGEGGISLTNNKDYFLRMSIYGHFNRNENELSKLDNYKKYSKTGISKKLRAHPLGIVLASVDLKNLDSMNQIKNDIYNKIEKIISEYKSISSMQLNHKASRGGFFGGYPIIFENEEKINEIKKIFKKFDLELFDYHWMNHHKMDIYSKDTIDLPITENILNKFYLIKIPFFLNFKFKNLKMCLKECKINKLIG